MIDLDAPEALSETDRADLLGVVEATAEQWNEAARRARAASGYPDAGGLANVVYCGMGGSGIAGDVLAALAAERSGLPVTVVKSYDVPAFVGPDTLVLCVSYSGNTEETLSCFDQALARGARIVTLSTGGTLAARAAEAGLVCIAPVEGLQPRAALASLLVPTLVVAQRMGVLPDLDGEIDEAGPEIAACIAAWKRDVPRTSNDAKRIATALGETLPIVWGQHGLLAVAAVRWRCQLNENAKVPSYSSVLPELDHNELVGYDPGIPTLGSTTLLVLRSDDEHPRIAKRIDATLGLVADRVARIEHVRARGVSPLARFMSLAVLADFASIYLACARGVDPTPVVAIEGLKRTLAS